MRFATLKICSLSTLAVMACSSEDPSYQGTGMPAPGGQAGSTVDVPSGGTGMTGGAGLAGMMGGAGGGAAAGGSTAVAGATVNGGAGGDGAVNGGAGGDVAGGGDANGGAGGMANPGPKPKVLFVSGSNHHDWMTQDPYLINILKSSGIFESIEYLVQPAPSDDASWAAWNPTWTDYDVVVHNLDIKHGNGRDWPDSVKSSFESYMANGGAMATLHAGAHGRTNWPEYMQMTGGTWAGSNTGCSWEVVNGVQTMVPQGDGPQAIDTALTDQLAHVLDPAHPITQGFPAVRKVITDNSSVYLRGPCEGITILDYALSVDEGKGANGYFPVSWTKVYKDQGRVFFHAPMHVMANSSNDVLHEADDVGFQTIWIRGVEWAATGAVTYPVPENMPTETAEARRDLCPSPCEIMDD